MDNADAYAPCPCGSGKKYKFCCYLKLRAGGATATKITFGPDSLRLQALQALSKQGAASATVPEGVEVLLKGKRQKVTCTGTALNSDYVFCEDLPKKLAARYGKMIKESRGARPNWDKVETMCRQVLAEAPGDFPARYNYAISLMQRQCLKLAQKINPDNQAVRMLA